jgi:DNA-binding NarL/FixJ family response regulator
VGTRDAGPDAGAARLRVFVADDHPIVRAGLRALIDAQPDMTAVGEAADGEGAARDAPAARPDVVVLDVRMPGCGGVAAAGAIARACPGVRVLAVSAHEDAGYVRQMLAAGAAGYVVKRAAADDLVRAIRVVAAGGTYLDPVVAGVVAGPYAGREAEPAAELSDREAEVVRLIARGYSNKEIGAMLKLSVKTVETYKARTFKKLGVRSRVGLVQFAAERGWL